VHEIATPFILWEGRRMLETDHPPTTGLSVLTIGCSDHPVDHFPNPVKNRFKVVVDTRSNLYSNSPQSAANLNRTAATPPSPRISTRQVGDLDIHDL
jgi:hypothetical protein